MIDYYTPLTDLDPQGVSWLSRARQWDIEYGDYLSNHIAHNWVVMAAVNEPLKRFAWWESLYNLGEDGCVPAREPGCLEPPRSTDGLPTITEENWQSHIEHSRVLFPAYQVFFDQEICQYGLSETLKAYFPVLAEGMAGAALHPVIHLGFGLDVSHEPTVADGLAYMATAFQPLGTRLPHTFPDQLWSPEGLDPIAASRAFLLKARDEDLFLIAHKASQTPEYLALKNGMFQPRIVAFDDQTLPLASKLSDTGPLCLPDVSTTLTPAVEACMILIATAMRESDNEFFILHGLTSLHATLTVLPHLESKDQRDALCYWWRASMATLVAQNLPGLDNTLSVLTSHGACSGQSTPILGNSEWLSLIRRSFESLDEHVPKALFVLWRWSGWRGISPAAQQVFSRAARHLMKPYEPGKLHENLWSNSFTEQGHAVRLGDDNAYHRGSSL